MSSFFSLFCIVDNIRFGTIRFVCRSAVALAGMPRYHIKGASDLMIKVNIILKYYMKSLFGVYI